MKRRIATVLGTVAAATILTVTQASALTHEQDHATATSAGTDADNWVCQGPEAWSQVCYARTGDWFQIEDRDADGHSAVAYWSVRAADGTTVRYGHIWNTAGNNTWRYQNKDLPEGYKLIIQNCYGEYEGHVVIDCGPSLNTTT